MPRGIQQEKLRVDFGAWPPAAGPWTATATHQLQARNSVQRMVPTRWTIESAVVALDDGAGGTIDVSVPNASFIVTAMDDTQITVRGPDSDGTPGGPLGGTVYIYISAEQDLVGLSPGGTYTAENPGPPPPVPWFALPSGGESILPLGLGALVNPEAPGAADDGDMETPFVTIQAAIDTTQAEFQTRSTPGFPPYASPQQEIPADIFVVSGIFDEALNLPAGLLWRLWSFGSVTLGNGQGPSRSSTNSQDIVINLDAALIPPLPFQNSIEPGLVLGTLSPTIINPNAAAASGWIVSGSIRDNLVGLGHNLQVHLHQTWVQSGAGVDLSQNTVSTRLHLRNTELLNLVGSVVQIAQAVDSTVQVIDIDGIAQYTRGVIGRNMTLVSNPAGPAPVGFWGVDFQGTSIVGPAGCARFDGGSHHSFRTGGGVLIAPATIVRIDDGPDSYGEMYQTDNAAATVITGIGSWQQVANFIAGELSGDVNFVGNALVVQEPRKYRTVWALSGISVAVNQLFEHAIFVNAVLIGKSKQERFYATSDVGSVAGTCILNLAPGDIVDIRVRNMTAINNIVISQANVNINDVLV